MKFYGGANSGGVLVSTTNGVNGEAKYNHAGRLYEPLYQRLKAEDSSETPGADAKIIATHW
jgi:hypothetical protein